MLEKRIAESHASLERKFEHLAKQLLEPGAPAAPGQVSLDASRTLLFLVSLGFQGEFARNCCDP
jgi:hypothetical protein